MNAFISDYPDLCYYTTKESGLKEIICTIFDAAAALSSTGSIK